MTKLHLAVLLLLPGLVSNITHASPLGADAIQAVLNAPQRPSEDNSRDADRQPHLILDFIDIAPGDTVFDMFAGAGWYTELFSRAVGPDGTVYAHNDPVIWRFAEQGINARTADQRLPNVVRIDNTDITAIEVPDNSVDIIFTALNYHDLFFTDYTKDGEHIVLRESVVNYRDALARLKKALKPDGIMVIIDHAATPGSGYDAANVLHRIDPDIVRFQMAQAGFSLVEQAYYLHNPDDDLSRFVFAPDLRGKTDRFIFKFTPQP
ncbi:methyltransferase domain-containing protein [Aestuariibacter halophilus]|uniref:Methyltransferase domain-containing protein n=1 Tax=Fluctibacter halophilus TaxID=226011 RepID=A0ABS8GGG7_9ALTE|nr:methyltransferase domain-containing protein [Aestuariibacter halophilus]MCC2618271.1 methyltransferase domain-containing protein [Aestuariibacter halophilus]